jgi:GNAT superfamily N-acetyltransferase
MILVPVPYDGPDQLLFSDRSEDVDFHAVLLHIQATYFGKDRTIGQLIRQASGSMCFSLFLRNRIEQGMVRQVGFARVVTDRVSFGWVCDVVIEGKYRRRGWGKILMNLIIEHPELKNVTLNLGTRDAHSFYAQLGFDKCEQMMRRAHG